MSNSWPVDGVVQGTHNGPRTGGYIEQWQRELERAYQQYVDAMQSTGPRKVRADASLGDRNPPSAMRATVPDAHAPGADDQPSAAGRIPVPRSNATGATPAASAATGLSMTRDSGIMNMSAGAPRARVIPGAAPATPTDRPGGLSPVVRNLLPEGSSVSLLQVDGRLHLIVRDSALEPQTLLRLVSRIKSGFGASGRLLSTITLNGERIWQWRDNPIPTTTGAERRVVDRHY